MRRIIQWYKNLKFRNKVLLSHIAVSLIPVIVLGIFCYAQVSNLLIEREKEVLEETLRQNVTVLDGNLTSYKYYMDSLTWNSNLKQAVTEEYSSNMQMYLMYRDIIDPMILNIRNLNPSVERVTIFSSNGTLFPHGDNLKPLEEMEISLEELKDSKIHWYFDGEQTLELYCRIYAEDKNEQNIVYMKINGEQTFSGLKTLFEDDYGVLMTDRSGNPVFSYLLENGIKKGIRASVNRDEIIQSGQYVVKQDTIEVCNWQIMLYRPLGVVSAAARSITVLVSAVILICLGLVILLSFLLSKSVTKPLGRLIHNVEQIEAGNLTVDIHAESSDEIGQLIQSFGSMVERLDFMVNEVYQSKITQQEYEMKALQAQINPHFLYNSLSLINWKAIMAEQEEISEMAQLLSTFYRTTLNKGKNVTTVKGEWDNTSSYIRIQRMMHSGKFEAELQIEDSILEYEILNLLLQPLVENAIVHGLDHKENEGVKKLWIRGKEQADSLVFEVCDNGCGIQPDVLERILTVETKGYGVQNVHHRIQLYYGEMYGLTYESERNRGTRVQLRIPKVKAE